MRELQESHLYLLIVVILAGCIAIGIAIQGPAATIRGVISIQQHPARLLNDFTRIGGDGAALVNAALVAGVGLLLVRIARVRLSGPTVAAVFTMLGFGLFGKTPLNILPIIAGVAIAARLAQKTFQEYILMALYGTALGPLITALAVEAGLPVAAALAVAAFGGLLVGILLPSVAISMLRLHQGFNLYNIGLTCGFIGVFAASILVASGRSVAGGTAWNDDPSLTLILLIPAVSILLMAVGLSSGAKRGFRGFLQITRLSGRLPSDFMTMASTEGALVNAGIVGLLMWTYVLVIGGDYNGPVLGGIFTAIGFATFGKHPKNAWPVLGGVVAACLLFGKDLSAPGPLLAALFVLTLAPVAGEFGPVLGLIAGFLHLVMVERTGSWHLGVNLYNNGFAGGLTATLLVAVVEWFRSTRGSFREQPSRRSKERVTGDEQ